MSTSKWNSLVCLSSSKFSVVRVVRLKTHTHTAHTHTRARALTSTHAYPQFASRHIYNACEWLPRTVVAWLIPSSPSIIYDIQYGNLMRRKLCCRDTKSYLRLGRSQVRHLSGSSSSGSDEAIVHSLRLHCQKLHEASTRRTHVRDCTADSALSIHSWATSTTFEYANKWTPPSRVDYDVE